MAQLYIVGKIVNMIILFDLDGTVIDSTEAILEGFHHTFDLYNTPHPTDEEIKALIGYPLDIMYRELHVDENVVWDYVKSYKEYYRVISTQKTELLKGAKEAIVCASKFAELGIVTTKTGKYSEVLMEHFELMGYFDVLIGREHVKNPKPHEEPILKALESFDVENKEIWMIGDTKLDLICAKNAGVKGIGVLSGYDDEVTLREHTDKIYADVQGAVSWLQSIKTSKS